MKQQALQPKKEKKLKVETETAQTIQVVTFSIVNEINKKKENYAVPIDQVKEIRQFENITKVPKAKHFVKGIMNLRGMIIPVVDVKNRLGFGETGELNTNYRVLIADVRDSVYGLIVDTVEQVMEIPINDIEPIPPDSFESHHYIKGIAKINGKLIVLLDIIALLEDDPEVNSTEVTNTEDLQPLLENSDSNNKNFETKKEKDDSIDNDIPDVLKEVFKEDENANPPKDSSS
jgi:purine-binding chemotaxis protein CheW